MCKNPFKNISNTYFFWYLRWLINLKNNLQNILLNVKINHTKIFRIIHFCHLIDIFWPGPLKILGLTRILPFPIRRAGPTTYDRSITIIIFRPLTWIPVLCPEPVVGFDCKTREHVSGTSSFVSDRVWTPCCVCQFGRPYRVTMIYDYSIGRRRRRA